MIHFIINLLIKALEILFGKDFEKYFEKYSSANWYRIVQIVIIMAVLYVFYYIARISIGMYKGKSDYLIISPDKENEVNTSAKTPYSRPDFKGQIATGSCPKCGYPYVYAKRSWRTGELYFSCGSTKTNNKMCNFKGCRSY